MTYRFTVEGAPRGKDRPRFGQGRAFTSKRTREYEKRVRWAFQTGGPNPPFAADGVPVAVEILARFQVPKKTSKATRARMLDGELRPLKKPDSDNIGKIICDALNGLAWEDDCQVQRLTVEKIWAEEPDVTVTIGVGE